ncbi:MAG: heat-inducible transcriptional repressor HrcA [Actinomycetota bacterium]
MLDDRKAAILRAIVREHVRSGEPVGSKALAARFRLKVSPATIRNDMAVLEEQGYLMQPHTSAGRVPTARGYRWFVDNWPVPEWPELGARDRRAIDGAFRSHFHDLEDSLETTSQVLSTITEALAVVAAPPSRRNRLRRLELVRRDDHHATLLLIADTGVVEQGVVEFPEPQSEEALEDAARALSAELDGVAFEDVPARLQRSSQSDLARVAITAEIGDVLRRCTVERIFRGGTANILARDKLVDLEAAHDVVGVVEKAPMLSALLEAARQAGNVIVFIGEENPIREMRVCGVVFSPYEVSSDRLGTLGVIGPTRMDYPHAISAVEAVARSLSSLLDAAGA